MAPYTFTLFAPYNKAAGLRLKNANARMFGLDIPMEKNEEDGYFRVTVELADGIYHYQFKIITKSWFEVEPEPAVPSYTNDETMTIEENEERKKNQDEEYIKMVQDIRDRNRKREEESSFTELWYSFVDPYATDVDERGSDDAYKSVGVLTFKNGKRILDEYEWKYDNAVKLVPDEQLIIYELHIGDFQSKFTDVTAKIDYIKQLGVNCVEIMPVKEYAGTHSWGYSPRYYFAIETGYGTSADFKELIDELHKNGIRVIMDGVYNHSECSNPMAQIDHDYWFHHEPKDLEMSWGPEWNYKFYDPKYNVWPARKYIGESILYMITEFHIDGIRFDAAKQIENFEFLTIMVDQCKSLVKDKPFYCVAEYLPDDVCVIRDYNGPMDGCWHDSMYWIIREALLNDNVEWEKVKDVIDGKRQGYKRIVNLVNYVSNHDHDRLLVELGKEHQLFDEEAFRRVRLGAAIQMTAFGLVLIWMGEEFGEYKEKTPGMAKLDWSLIDDLEDNSNQINKDLLQYYKDLIHLRKTNPSLYTTNINFIYENEQDGILVYHRWNDIEKKQGDHLIVIVNWSKNTLTDYEIINMPMNGKYYDWINNQEHFVENNQLKLDEIKDHEAKILIWEYGKADAKQIDNQQ